MPIPFPPGDIRFKSNAPRSPWREFAFILHQIQHVVEPGLSLAGAMADWPRLARGLRNLPGAEKPRLKNIITKQVSAYGVNPGLCFFGHFGPQIGKAQTAEPLGPEDRR